MTRSREMINEYKERTLLLFTSVLVTGVMVFKRYTHSTASKKSVLGPYSGLKVPKRKIIKNRSYYIPSEDNRDIPYAYMESSDEGDEPAPDTVSNKRCKKRVSTSKRSHPVKKRRYLNDREEEDYSEDNDDYVEKDNGYTDDDDEEQEEDDVKMKIKSKKKHRHRKIKQLQTEIRRGHESDEDNDIDEHHHGRGLEFVRPKKMTVSMKLKEEEQKQQKVEDSDDENPEIIVKKLNNLGSVINDKQSASVLDLKNTDISLLSSTLKGVVDAQLPEIPGLDKEELKKFCKTKTTLKEKKRMLMDSQFLTPVGKYLSLLEIDN